MSLQPIETAPRDKPILAWCDHEADPYHEPSKPGDPAGSHRLTLYAAHADGMGHAPTGFHIIEWGGAFDDSTWEHPNQASLPDWWFVVGSEFEVAANPTHWMPLPSPPLWRRLMFVPSRPVPGSARAQRQHLLLHFVAPRRPTFWSANPERQINRRMMRKHLETARELRRAEKEAMQ